MKRLKVTAVLEHGRIVYNGDLYLDGILYNQKIKVTNKNYWDFSSRSMETGKGDLGRVELPIARHTDQQVFSFNEKKEMSYHNQKNSDVWLTSKAYLHKKSSQIIDKCRKRFEDLRSEDWVKDTKRIYTSMGKYKNYDIPFSVTLTPTVHWICIGDKQEFERLLSGIYAIGKEINRGFGRVKEWRVEETNEFGERNFPTVHIAPHEWLEKKRTFPPYSLRTGMLNSAMRYF